MIHAELKAFTQTADGHNNVSSCCTVSIVVAIKVVLSEGKIKIRKHICEVVPPVDKMLVVSHTSGLVCWKTIPDYNL